MAEQKHTPNAMDVEEALSSSEAYLIKNKKLISGVILAVVVIVGGWLLYNHFIATPKELKASTMLAKGQEYCAMRQYDMALNGGLTQLQRLRCHCDRRERDGCGKLG